ncbi:MAG: HAD hydrolase family protein, partial [Spirochaetales bacterium]|nr:HAD hydrolase family protein [Spirochaetales bacterium]
MTCPIELISIDVDFTLVDDDKRIPARNREAILWARYQKGVHIAINSGRIAPSVRTYMEEIGIDD